MQVVDQGKLALGIEFGSTNIKAVVLNEETKKMASASYPWKAQFVEGYWSYDLKEAWIGLKAIYKEIKGQIEAKTNEKLHKFGAIAISGMMHGYLPFNKSGQQIAGFITWQNTITEEAAYQLTKAFDYNIPQRWSVAHLYQQILDQAPHVKEIDYLTTLSGYIHWKLTGEKVMGIGEASGMFPVSSTSYDYQLDKVAIFNNLAKVENYSWEIENVLPKVKKAGENAGFLTTEGALLIDPTGELQAGIPFSPPEGDAGTGMVATNSVAYKTGNISAGTSIFAMLVLESEMEKVHIEIDPVSTPDGKAVAMIHCNNFTDELNTWVQLFIEIAERMGQSFDKGQLYQMIFNASLEADENLGKLMISNYLSGEPITGFSQGRPLIVRKSDSNLSLANFSKSLLYSSVATLKIGMDMLQKEENVSFDYLLGHGGFFKTEVIGQQILADALDIPIAVMDSATEGGPWGSAVLASFLMSNENDLDVYLNEVVFVDQRQNILNPDSKGVDHFSTYMQDYQKLLEIEKSAIENY